VASTPLDLKERSKGAEAEVSYQRTKSGGGAFEVNCEKKIPTKQKKKKKKKKKKTQQEKKQQTEPRNCDNAPPNRPDATKSRKMQKKKPKGREKQRAAIAYSHS